MNNLTTIVSKSLAMFALGLSAFVPAASAQQPEETIVTKTRQVIARTNQNLEAIEAVRKGFDTFGRRWGETSFTRRAPEPAPVVRAPAPAPVPASGRNTIEIRTSLVSLIKSVPAQVGLGETFSYDLRVTALDDIGNIVVTDTIPQGASYVRSEAAATVDAGTLTWKIPSMHKGDVQDIKVWLRADREGDLTGCATIFAIPRKCVTTVVGKATLEISKTGPEQALLGTDVVYKVLVTNKGSTAAKDVVVTDTFPDGLTASTGQKEIQVDLGELAPRQAKTFTITLKAAKRGRHVNTAAATSSNAEKVSAEAATLVVQQGLKVLKTGDTQQFLGRRATYEVVVGNTGDTPLSNVVVTDNLPADYTLLAAEGATVAGTTATWKLASLAPGEEKRFTVIATAKVAGTFVNRVQAVSGEGLSQSAEATTIWRGVSALLLEKSDDPDPILIGGATTYTVRVTNQGFADDTNVSITVVFPKELLPTDAPGGAINGQTVTFPPIARLQSKQAVAYTIKAKGVAEGDVRVKFSLTADSIRTPVNADESTRIY